MHFIFIYKTNNLQHDSEATIFVMNSEAGTVFAKSKLHSKRSYGHDFLTGSETPCGVIVTPPQNSSPVFRFPAWTLDKWTVLKLLWNSSGIYIKGSKLALSLSH